MSVKLVPFFNFGETSAKNQDSTSGQTTETVSFSDSISWFVTHGSWFLILILDT